MSRIILICLLTVAACASEKGNPKIEIQTRAGDIVVELYPAQAPKTVAAILSYIDSGFYENASFYRVLNMDNQPSDAPKAELIQGGLWATSSGKREYLSGIEHETTSKTNILHKDGTISLARHTPGTATTEFFICIGDQPGFDFGGENNPDGQGYAAFGKVIKGMDVVRKIYNMPENEQQFDPPVPIFNIRRL